MHLPFRWGPFVSLLLLPLVAEPGPRPHPERADRRVGTWHGVEVEYSPGQDRTAAAVARALDGWLARAAEAATPGQGVPFSPRDLAENRDAVLEAVAHWVGLEAPTAVQQECYDTFVACYRHALQVEHAAAALWSRLAATRRVALWTQPELRRRFQAGEPVPDFHYDAAAGRMAWQVAFEPLATGADDRLACEAADRLRLDHPANYVIRGTVAELAGSVRDWRHPWPSPADASTGLAGSVHAVVRSLDLVLPVMLDDAAGPLAPGDAIRRHLATRAEFRATAERHAAARQPQMVRLILHETTELGLVDRIIGAPGRRWLCEGTANFVARAVAAERAGAAFAQEMFDLPRALREAAVQQPAVSLRDWAPAEHGAAGLEPPVVAAHHAFATRAIESLVREQGEAVLPAWWREIRRTPREAVTMATVAQAFEAVTGMPYAPWLERMERSPVPGALTATGGVVTRSAIAARAAAP